MLVMPPGHVIADQLAFHQSIQAGLTHALNGGIVTLRIVLDRPTTGYGDIKVGENFGVEPVRKLKAFAEKPELEAAQTYVLSGNYL